MTRKAYTPEEGRRILVRLNACKETLEEFGMITPGESRRIFDRLVRWRDEHDILISQAYLDSVGFTYDDQIK